MMRRSGPIVARAGRINVTPMIDVVMVLIVFFLMVGKMAADQRADLPLPLSRTGVSEDAEGALVVEIRRLPDASATFTLAGTDVSPDALEALFRAELHARPDRAIRIRADRTLPYGAVEPAIEAARRAGASSVHLASERSAP